MIIRFKKFIGSLIHAKLVFYILGIGSTIWFLIRVIPKPSRAGYPCMRASAPFMSAFVLYFVGLASTVYIFKNNKGRLFLLKGVLAMVFVVSLLFSFQVSTLNPQFGIVDVSYFKANIPIGVAQGIFPGRVAWVYNPNVTNQNMTNKTGDYWYMDKNCPQAIVDSMLISGIRRIGGKANIGEAWDAVFKYFNKNHGNGSVGYTPGEKIAIKINLTNSCCNGGTPNAQMDASPQMVLSILRQLVDAVGVAQADIWMGDPYRIFRNEYYDKCHALYPNVHYVDGTGNVGGRTGREVTKPSSTQVLKFSDGQETASLPQHYLDATYLINMPCLKSHDAGGITLAAKNHQGSILNTSAGDKQANQSAYYMHYALPMPPDQVQGTNKYRHLVDYMGHKDLGGKTLLYIVDALWAGKNWNGEVEKWKMAPFNNDYPSSIFISQDAVAIESVGFDFLLKEYSTKSASEKYPYMTGVDDYMRQAADPANWPADVQYDPEGDGTLLKSLGVYEHWNNSTEMKYSRNLGTEDGIELLKYNALETDDYAGEFSTGMSQRNVVDCKLYPNPFAESIRIDADIDNELNLYIYNLQGQLVFNTLMTKSFIWNGTSRNGSKLSKGTYLIKLTEKNSGKLVWTEKVICNKK